MSEWTIVCIIGTSFLGVIGIWIKAYYDYRKRRTGNNPHPCAKNGERIARLEEAVKDIREDIREIKWQTKKSL